MRPGDGKKRRASDNPHEPGMIRQEDIDKMNTEELMKKAVGFHGHACPGLAIGVRAAGYVLGCGNEFSDDEEIVAVVENDNCSVDALQALLGTTFGKGNLKFLDYGKNNYTFYSRKNRSAVKLIARGMKFGESELSREDRIKYLLAADIEDLFEIRPVEFIPPAEAEIHKSISCDNCHQSTMSTRIVIKDGRRLCIPCSQESPL